VGQPDQRAVAVGFELHLDRARADPDLAVDGADTYRETRLPELFTPNPEQLFVYHMMFDPEWEQGCRMCSMWLDGLDAVAHHIRETTSFAVVAKAELPKLRAWARHRGWDRLRLLSSYGSSFNRDLGAETPEWGQQARVSVFTKDAGGTVRLRYWGDPYFGEGVYRGIDLLSPVWNVLDPLPGGRGAWEPSEGH
jgi:predicted dithiol-disulfide oxidoreductase (DUF899 family)